MSTISSDQLVERMRAKLSGVSVRAVTGPGRSGAIASVFASHMLGVPFIPYGHACPPHLRPLLIIDTARLTGATIRKAERRYAADGPCVSVCCFEEPPRVRFWYESTGAKS